DHADHLGRVVGLIEQFVEVGSDNVASAGENSHPDASGRKGVANWGARVGAKPFDLAVDPRRLVLIPRGAARGDRRQRIARVTAHASTTSGEPMMVAPAWLKGA